MRKFLYSSVVLGLCATGANAFDYKVSGSAESFTKAGFNNQKLNEETGATPTDSFTTIFGQLNINAELVPGLKAGLGGAIGGLAFDSTRSGSDPVTGSVNQDSYFGMANDRGKVQNYIVHNAFAEYSYNDNFYIKAGRYESGKVGEWFSGYTQGAEGYLQFSGVKVWGFLSNRRAFAYDQWFNDFYRVNGQYDSSKATRNIYAAGLDYTTGGLSLSAFSYIVPGKVVAPGASITFDTNPSFEAQGFHSVTKIRTLFPMAQGDFREGKANNINAGSTYRDWGKIENQTATLYIEQKFELDNFNFGAGYYQNFGNANGLIGTWGNPLMLDFWTATSYDFGRALSDMVGANAITGFGFFGAKYGGFDWKIIGRGTTSDRSDEQSVALYLNYQIREDIAIGGKLEWLNDTTKKGYHAYLGGVELKENRTYDRSHAFFYIRHTF